MQQEFEDQISIYDTLQCLKNFEDDALQTFATFIVVDVKKNNDNKKNRKQNQKNKIKKEQNKKDRGQIGHRVILIRSIIIQLLNT